MSYLESNDIPNRFMKELVGVMSTIVVDAFC